ncbi:Non-ribosomal peptide synthetase [Gnomoniopsis sp. IMI 355080]|nr:Non-ribosomal peptide synthetase [Gnomoniopsis sp. IMI 355080]
MDVEPDNSIMVAALRELYAEVLGINVTDVADDLAFIGMGGDSARAVILFQKCLKKRMNVFYQNLMHAPFIENAAALSMQGQTDPDHGRNVPTHPKFRLMDCDYDFSNIESELHNLGLDMEDVENIYPCSSTQENIYTSRQVGSPGLYWTKGVYEIHPSYTFLQIRDAWRDIVRRHEALRTLYAPVSTVAGESERLLNAIVLTQHAAETVLIHVVDERYDDADGSARSKPSSLNQFYATTRDVHHRVTVHNDVQDSGGTRTLVTIVLDHMIVDLSSLVIVMDEFSRAMQGRLSRAVEDTPTGYGRYIEYLQLQNSEEDALDYWVDYLGCTTACGFPLLNSDSLPASEQEGGSSNIIDVPLTTTMESLRRFCHRTKITIATAIQATWALVLYMYTGQNDVCFGYISSGRDLPVMGAAEIVGPMMNLLVCRVAGIYEKSVEDLVAGIRNDFGNALPHQCFSLRKVQRILGNNEVRLFNTIVNTVYDPSGLRHGDNGDEDQPIKFVSSHNASEYDIVVKAVYTEVGLRLRLAYSLRALSKAMAEHVAHTFASVLDRMVEGTVRASQVVQASPYDRRLVFAWNKHTLEAQVYQDRGPTSNNMALLIQGTAHQQPQAQAIYAWDGRMTYSELDTASDILARVITEANTPSAYVPLIFEKSKWYSVALLAVLKSGKAFVPLDLSNNPEDRVRRMLSRLNNPGLILCSPQYAVHCERLGARSLVCNEDLLEKSTGGVKDALSVTALRAAEPTDPAYVIFTSGSTGEPKGVVVEHAAYVHATGVHRTSLRIDATSRVLQFASYGFDTSIEDHLTTFAVGACLCVPSEEDRTTNLAAFATRAQANWAHVTPSLASRLLRRQKFTTLKMLLLGGEPMTAANVEEWGAAAAAEKPTSGVTTCQLIQVYGPSECCVTSTVGPVATAHTAPSNIGTALPGCATWIVRPDDPHELCPVGTVGELLIEGPILARSYIGQSKETSTAFVRGLRWAPEKRVYRTGDLVRYDAQGQLHFVGRKDGQVKIRGQRIELGEVESQLLMGPGIRQALAVFPESGCCAGKIVAVLATDEYTSTKQPKLDGKLRLVDKSWTNLVTNMRLYLEEKLPPYMMPELWLLLAEIPTNSSAKMDRKRVQQYIENMSPEQYQLLIGRMSGSPENDKKAHEDRCGSEIEALLRKLWSKALNVPETQIDWNSSFYSLGGDSITAMMVASLCRQHNLAVAAADILRHRCIERLVKGVPLTPPHSATEPVVGCSRRVSSNHEPGQVELEYSAFPLSPIQCLHFRVSGDVGDSYDQQTILVQVRETLDQDRVIAAFDAIINAHPMLRARFIAFENKATASPPTWRQRTLPSSTNTKTENNIRLRFHSRTRADYLVDCVSDAKASIDITKGPLVAADIFQTQGRASAFLSVTIHHLVVDAVSWRIIFQQLESFLRHGDERAVQHEHTSFREWSQLAQHQFAAREHSDKHHSIFGPTGNEWCDLTFWETDGSQNVFASTKTSKFRLDASLLQNLRMLCHALECEIVDLVTAATVMSFAGAFGRPPRLFLEGHGREDFSNDRVLDPTMTVGWFTTFSPLHVSDQDVASGHLVPCLHLVRRLRRQQPLNGLRYFTSTMLGDVTANNGTQTASHVPMELVLNHLGTFQDLERADSLFRRCDDDELTSRLSALRHSQRRDSRRYALVSVISTIQDDCLSVEVEWNSLMAHQEQLRQWISDFEFMLSQATTTASPITNPTTSILVSGKQIRGSIDGSVCAKLGVLADDIEAMYPCSPLQESLLYSQLRDEDSTYSQKFLIRISLADDQRSSSSILDPQELVAAWQAVVAKHPILRTVFVQDDSGAFMQAVLRYSKPEVLVRQLHEEDEASFVHQLWERESLVPGCPPLCGKPLHSFEIYTSSSPGRRTAYCLMSKNHLITDGSSSRILLRDFEAAYDGHLDMHPVPFADYIQYVSRHDIADLTQYWARYLDGFTPLKFAAWGAATEHIKSEHAYKPRKEIRQFERVKATISADVGIASACRTMDMTASIVFKGAWAWVLAVYMNAEDVTYGALYGGRDISQVPSADQIVGPMANMLPIRTRIAPGMTTPLSLCTSIQGDEFDHMARQTLSLARIQHAAKLQDHQPLFNTILNFQKSSSGGTALSPETSPSKLATKVLRSSDTSEFDVALSIVEETGDFRISIEYPTSFMQQTDARRLLEAFKTAVRQVIANWDTPLDKLSLVSDEDRTQIEQWNIVHPWPAADCCIHDMIQHTVLSQPLCPAICAWDGEMTYAELDDLSTRLATHLQHELGCRSDSVVVLCFEKSLWAVVAMLGVAKTGSAFVHVDINAPAERIRTIITQTQATVGLTSQETVGKIRGLVRTTFLVDAEMIMKTLHPEERPLDTDEAKPSNTLYIIFTSGSTGTPKGVVIQHRSFCSAVTHNQSWLRLQRDSRVLQFTAYAFDASLEEIFTVLVAGGCICIPSEQDRLTDVAGFIRRADVNWAAFTPSFLRTLEPSDVLPQLAFITVHAEPMNGTLVERWADKVEMRPSYGPTECSVTATVGAPLAVTSDAANIGWPVGSRARVVHPGNHEMLLPIGAVGELVLEGPIVGSGYLNDAEKTAAAFFSRPTTWSHSSSPDAEECSKSALACYKTGDLVRYDSRDGSLVILGRKGFSQIKIRGQRVELLEVQHHLDACSHVLHSAVLAPRSGLLKGRLVAVLSLANWKEDTPDDMISSRNGDEIQPVSTGSASTIFPLQAIQNTLEQRLPAYMIPEDWLVVRNLPVQVSQKLDRQAIVRWVEEHMDQGTLEACLIAAGAGCDTHSQGNDTEETIKDIWAQVLEIPRLRVPLDVSFFRLGGDSIYAIQLMQLCRKRGIMVTTQEVLANPTVRCLARIAQRSRQPDYEHPLDSTNSQDGSIIESSHKAPTKGNLLETLPDVASILPVSAESIEAVWPCTPFQRRMYTAFRCRPNSPYLFDSLIELTEGLATDPQWLITAWQQTIDRHGILRTAFVPIIAPGEAEDATLLSQVVLKKWSADATVVHTEEGAQNLLALATEHRAAVRARLFEDNAPPVALRVYVTQQSGDKDSRCFAHLIMSHLMIDHVSFAHILSDWQRFYEGSQDEAGLAGPEPPPFGLYSCQRQSTDKGNEFWISALQDAKPCLLTRELYGDGVEITQESQDACLRSEIFTVELTSALDEFCRRVGTTLATVLQFVWAVLLHVQTGKQDVCFGQLVSDRDFADDGFLGGGGGGNAIGQVVGPMLALVVGRVRFTATDSLIEALCGLHDHNVRAASHKIYELEKVEEELGVESSWRLFDTLVNIRRVQYQGDDDNDSARKLRRKRFRSIHKRDPHEVSGDFSNMNFNLHGSFQVA